MTSNTTLMDSLFSAGRHCSTLEITSPPATDTELLVVNSARVSLLKSHSRLLDNDRSLIRFLYRHAHWTPFGHPQLTLIYPVKSLDFPKSLLKKTPGSETLVLDDEWIVERGSLWYWLRNRPLYGDYRGFIENTIAKFAPITAEIAGIPPFERTYPTAEFPIMGDAWVAEDLNRLKLGWLTVVISAPVPIRTQLFKHKVGFVENEVSRRYVDAPPSFYLPPEWRARAPNIKQGSLKTPIEHPKLANLVAKIVYFVSNWGYNTLLSLGGCPEQARFLLSQGMMTQWYWTGSLDAVLRAIHLRDSQHAQEETWKLMQTIRSLLEQQWPRTFQQMPWS